MMTLFFEGFFLLYLFSNFFLFLIIDINDSDKRLRAYCVILYILIYKIFTVVIIYIFI